MNLENLMSAIQQLQAEKKPNLKCYNMHKLTFDTLRKMNPLHGREVHPSFLGVRVYEVAYLYPGYVEAERMDGTKEIIHAITFTEKTA